MNYAKATTIKFATASEAERMWHDYPLLQRFYGKHALGGLAAPSCLCCGQQTHPITRPIAVQHMELPAIVVCKQCKDASGVNPSAALSFDRWPKPARDAYEALERHLEHGPSLPLAYLMQIRVSLDADGVNPSTAYRLLERGEVIQKGDEVMDDDTVNWHPLAGWEIGAKWDGGALMPMRRAVPHGVKETS